MKKEFIVNRSSSVTLNITAGKIDSYRKNEETTGTVRVYRDGKIGVAGMLGTPDEAALTERAEAALAAGIPYPDTPDTALIRVERFDGEIIPEKEFLPAIQALLDRIGEACPRFALSNKITLGGGSREYRNSEGRALTWSDRALSIALVFQDRGAGNLMDGFFEYTDRHFDPEHIIARCREYHDAFYRRAEINEGELPVIFAFPELFGHMIRHFTGEMYASGASLFSGKLGETCFSERLTLAVDRNRATVCGVPFFDDEGCTAPDDRVPLIENGILRNLLVNKKNAARFGLPVSGTASEAAYDGVPAVNDVPAFLATPTAKTLAELVPSKAVFVSMASGGDMTPSGHFATPVQGAFLMEGGKLIGRLPEVNVSGDLFDLLGKDYLGAVIGDPDDRSAYCAVTMKVTKA